MSDDLSILRAVTTARSIISHALFPIRKVKAFAFQANRFISYRCRKWQSLVNRTVSWVPTNHDVNNTLFLVFVRIEGNHKGLPVRFPQIIVMNELGYL